MSNQNEMRSLEVTQKNYLEKITKAAKEQELNFTEYQKNCVSNALRSLYPLIKNSNYSISQFDKNNVYDVLSQVAFLQLNPAATPRECYFQIRKNYNPRTRQELAPTIEFAVEGAGNDVILKKFGEIKRIKSYIVYEGDEFTEGYEDGWDTKLPVYKRTFKTNKPIRAVYLLLRNDGETDVVYGTLEDVKKSLLGNARNNGAGEDLIRELDKHDLYELLDPNGKWVDKKISKGKYETRLFSIAYTSPVSKFNMIERKLRNHATRKYPKNFQTSYIQEKYEKTFDETQPNTSVIDADYTESIDDAQNEFNTKQGTEELQEEQDENTENKKEEINEDAGEELVAEKSQESEDNDAEVEKETEENPQDDEKKAETPDWFNE